MTATTLRWGLIGSGGHAARYLMPALRDASTARFRALLTRDVARGREAADPFGCEVVHDDADAFFADPTIDAVLVSSPNHLHREQVERAAAAGKHVLCEKPLAPTADDCAAMVTACHDAGVVFATGFHLRANPVHVAAREVLVGGGIGALLAAEVQYMHVTAHEAPGRARPAWRLDPKLSGGGRLMGSGLHGLDLLRYVTGSEVASVQAMPDASYDATGRDELLFVTMRLDGGQPVVASSGPMAFPTNGLALYGREGTLRCSDSIGYGGGGRLEVQTAGGSDVRTVPPCDVYALELDDFAAAVATGAAPRATGVDGLRAMELAEAVYASLASACRVSVTRRAVT